MKDEGICQICFGLQLHTQKVDEYFSTTVQLANIWESLLPTDHPDIRTMPSTLANHMALKEKRIHKQNLLATFLPHLKIEGRPTLFSCTIAVPKVTRAIHTSAIQNFLSKQLIMKGKINVREEMKKISHKKPTSETSTLRKKEKSPVTTDMNSQGIGLIKLTALHYAETRLITSKSLTSPDELIVRTEEDLSQDTLSVCTEVNHIDITPSAPAFSLIENQDRNRGRNDKLIIHKDSLISDSVPSTRSQEEVLQKIDNFVQKKRSEKDECHTLYFFWSDD